MKPRALLYLIKRASLIANAGLERHASFVETVCERVGALVPFRIFGEPDDPYLGRHYLFRKSWAPRVVREYLPSFYLHYFFRGDQDVELHNHPWKISFSLILTNGYVEERRTPAGIVRRVLKPGSINVIRESDYHRVKLIDPTKGAWTLFVAGSRVNDDWTFWHPIEGRITNWQEFVKQRTHIAAA